MDVPQQKERVVVIGGGLSGCLSALFAARVKNPDGSLKYDVTLLEAQDKILNGASIIASRIHQGGEYPLHYRTAFGCMWSAALWKMIFPEKGTFTAEPPLRFFLARTTNRKGILTSEKFNHNFEDLQSLYESVAYNIALELQQLPDAARQRWGVPIPSPEEPPEALGKSKRTSSRETLKNWKKTQAQDIAMKIRPEVEQRFLFGPAENFAKPIPPRSKELEIFGNHMHSGMVTQEIGIDIPGILSAFEPALQ
jgi:monoamine oxidase